MPTVPVKHEPGRQALFRVTVGNILRLLAGQDGAYVVADGFPVEIAPVAKKANTIT